MANVVKVVETVCRHVIDGKGRDVPAQMMTYADGRVILVCPYSVTGKGHTKVLHDPSQDDPSPDQEG